MAARLSSRDLDGFEAALSALLNPWDHPDSEDWSDAVCQSVRAVTGVDTVATLLRREGRYVIGCDGVSARDIQAYAASWFGRIPGERRRHSRRLKVWVREDVWPWSEVSRTVYFNEFCRRARTIDSAGMSVGAGPAESMVLYLGSETASRFVPGGREALLLRLLQPAMAAATRSLERIRNPAQLVDALETPVALFTMAGQLVHANTAFGALCAGDTTSTLMDAARRIAREVASLGCVRPVRDGGRPAPRTRWKSADGQLALEGARWESSGLPYGPLCVISAATAPRTDRGTVMRSWPLTAREADVALLLARGLRNRDIAKELSISEHTARRHTEHVLNKLHITSRSGVAAVLLGNAASGGPQSAAGDVADEITDEPVEG